MQDSRDWREERRLRAIELYNKGWQQKLIAEALGVTKGAISQWIKKFKDVPQEQRTEAVRIKKSTGRKPAIAADDRPKLVALIEQGAEKLGFVGDVWTAPRVQAIARRELGIIARRELGINVGLTTIKKFLHAEGYSVQKPEVKATQQNVEAVAHFRADWTTLKKGQSRQEQR